MVDYLTNKYIDEGSDLCVNVSASTRSAIIRKVKTIQKMNEKNTFKGMKCGGWIDKYQLEFLFDDCYHEVYGMIDGGGALRRYQSFVFFSFLSPFYLFMYFPYIFCMHRIEAITWIIVNATVGGFDC